MARRYGAQNGSGVVGKKLITFRKISGMVLVLNSKSKVQVEQELEKLRRKKLATRKQNWSKFFGKVKATEDPVLYQRSRREE
ncbi:MAG: hypothetical protein JNK66_05575 [Chitinophagales bacterium]|nr:hypothetical protein [Chitinophagales bacterium]